MPIWYAIWIPAIEENAALVAQGLDPVNINTFETFFSGWLGIGGMGATLPLVIWFLFARSKKLKTIGKATLIPSLFNINEPVVYGAPVAFNPLLMVPMWINGLITPIIVYLALDMGFAQIRAKSSSSGIRRSVYRLTSCRIQWTYTARRCPADCVRRMVSVLNCTMRRN